LPCSSSFSSACSDVQKFHSSFHMTKRALGKAGLPSLVVFPPMWSGCPCVMMTVSMSRGEIPSARRFFISFPVFGLRPSAPVSTSTRCLPVLIIRQMYGLIHSAHRSGRRLCSRSTCSRRPFGALRKRKVAGGGKVGGAYVWVPSLTAMHSKVPTLNRYLSVLMVILVFGFLIGLILRISRDKVKKEAWKSQNMGGEEIITGIF